MQTWTLRARFTGLAGLGLALVAFAVMVGMPDRRVQGFWLLGVASAVMLGMAILAGLALRRGEPRGPARMYLALGILVGVTYVAFYGLLLWGLGRLDAG